MPTCALCPPTYNTGRLVSLRLEGAISRAVQSGVARVEADKTEPLSVRWWCGSSPYRPNKLLLGPVCHERHVGTYHLESGEMDYTAAFSPLCLETCRPYEPEDSLLLVGEFVPQ